MSFLLNGKTYLIPLVISGLGAMTVASAQTSGSPFSSKKAKQAWETIDPSPISAPRVNLPTASPDIVPNTSIFSNGSSSSPVESYSGALDGISSEVISSNSVSGNIPSVSGSNYTYTPAQTPSIGFEGVPSDSLAGARPTVSPAALSGSSETGAYYPGRENKTIVQSAQSAPPVDYSAAPPIQAPRIHNSVPGNPVRPGSWRDRLGLGNLKTSLKGFLRGGVALTRENLGALSARFRDDYVADLNVEAEASAITQGGLEYGFNFEVRSQYDNFRRGFGGRVGDCPASVPGCASTGGLTPVAVRGHTTQFFTDGPSNAEAFEVAIEGAYIFLRSAYGDVTLGLDDGSAYLFSLGAPTLLTVNASNSPVDFTGLDSVKTVNDASGFAEKITYTSPRLLGDQIGFGVQFGASYAPNARACGVDYCVVRNGTDGTGVLAPDLSDVIEFGAAIDRKFNNGINVEATFTYAMANEDSSLDVFDDLESWNTGLEVSLNDWTIGGSYLDSNNGLSNGDYTAWDAGITWKPSQLGFTASYGHAEDENINLTSDQAVFGVTYEFERFTLGAGVQYIERDVPVVSDLVVGEETERATALFVEGGFTF